MLEEVITADRECRAALRKGLLAPEEIDDEDAERYDGFAVMPTGLRFMYNLSHASGGQTSFVPYQAMPARCVLPIARSWGVEQHPWNLDLLPTRALYSS